MSAQLIVCPDCARKLRVPDELAEQLVKCPSCGRTFTAGGAANVPPLPAEPAPPARGDAVKREKKEVSDADSHQPRDEDDERPRRRPRDWEDDEDDDDDLGPRRDLEPDRGGMILTLGIVGLVLAAVGGPGALCCVAMAVLPVIGLILGVVAWVMGSKDLAAMRAGRIDRRGEGSTKAGRTCGIIAVALGSLVILLALVGGLALLILANN
jgi:ribosomal protein L37AE/L43A